MSLADLGYHPVPDAVRDCEASYCRSGAGGSEFIVIDLRQGTVRKYVVRSGRRNKEVKPAGEEMKAIEGMRRMKEK